MTGNGGEVSRRPVFSGLKADIVKAVSVFFMSVRYRQGGGLRVPAGLKKHGFSCGYVAGRAGRKWVGNRSGIGERGWAGMSVFGRFMGLFFRGCTRLSADPVCIVCRSGFRMGKIGMDRLDRVYDGFRKRNETADIFQQPMFRPVALSKMKTGSFAGLVPIMIDIRADDFNGTLSLIRPRR